MSINLIKSINYNRPECLYCGSICETSSGAEAAASFISYDCKYCGDYFTTFGVAGINELQFSCKEFCVFHSEDSDIYEVYNTNSASYENRTAIPAFEIDFS